jgi:hypothetical protein
MKKMIISIFSYCLIGTLVGCKTSQLKTETTTAANTETFDSISRIEREKARLLVVPESSVSLNLNFKNLTDLPIGAKYTDKQGQATVSIEKTGDNDYKITATCDSLAQLVIDKETEIYHLNNQLRELESNHAEVKEIIVNQLTGWQNFRVWIGNIALAALGIGIIYKIWQKKKPF